VFLSVTSFENLEGVMAISTTFINRFYLDFNAGYSLTGADHRPVSPTTVLDTPDNTEIYGISDRAITSSLNVRDIETQINALIADRITPILYSLESFCSKRGNKDETRRLYCLLVDEGQRKLFILDDLQMTFLEEIAQSFGQT